MSDASSCAAQLRAEDGRDLRSAASVSSPPHAYAPSSTCGESALPAGTSADGCYLPLKIRAAAHYFCKGLDELVEKPSTNFWLSVASADEFVPKGALGVERCWLDRAWQVDSTSTESRILADAECFVQYLQEDADPPGVQWVPPPPSPPPPPPPALEVTAGAGARMVLGDEDFPSDAEAEEE